MKRILVIMVGLVLIYSIQYSFSCGTDNDPCNNWDKFDYENPEAKISKIPPTHLKIDKVPETRLGELTKDQIITYLEKIPDLSKLSKQEFQKAFLEKYGMPINIRRLSKFGDQKVMIKEGSLHLTGPRRGNVPLSKISKNVAIDVDINGIVLVGETKPPKEGTYSIWLKGEQVTLPNGVSLPIQGGLAMDNGIARISGQVDIPPYNVNAHGAQILSEKEKPNGPFVRVTKDAIESSPNIQLSWKNHALNKRRINVHGGHLKITLDKVPLITVNDISGSSAFSRIEIGPVSIFYQNGKVGHTVSPHDNYDFGDFDIQFPKGDKILVRNGNLFIGGVEVLYEPTPPLGLRPRKQTDPCLNYPQCR